MKKMILSMVLLTIMVTTFGQTVDTTLSKDYYLRISKDQKIVGAVMLVAGVAMTSAGLIIGLQEFSENLSNAFSSEKPQHSGTGSAILFFGGAGLTWLSVPLLLASKRNARRAATISLHTQQVLFLQQNSLTFKNQPTLTFRLPFSNNTFKKTRGT